MQSNTCAVFGGKNSKENIGLPVRWASASLSLICILNDFRDLGAEALDTLDMFEIVRKARRKQDEDRLKRK